MTIIWYAGFWVHVSYFWHPFMALSLIQPYGIFDIPFKHLLIIDLAGIFEHVPFLTYTNGY